MGFDLPVMNRLRRSGRALSPASLFATGAQGVIYDPRDLSTMFQDSLGTTPVTAPGQVVGLRLDKSKNGIGTNGLSRRNLLTQTEAFNEAVWIKASGAAITVNTDTAPDGTLTADTLTTSGVPSFGAGLITQAVSVAATGVAFTFSAYLKASSTNKATIWLNLVGGAERVAVVVSLTSSYQRYTVSATFTSGSVVYPHVVAGDANLGTDAGSIFIWGAQLEIGSAATLYQRITSDWVATIPGNHATQATAGARLTYGIEPKTGTRNQFLYTEDLTNGVWVLQNTAVTANAIAAPTGEATADKLASNASGTVARLVYQNATFTIGLTYTLTVRLKAAGVGFAHINLANGYGGARFDISTGAVSSVLGGTTATIENNGDGWWLCRVTATVGEAGARANYIYLSNLGSSPDIPVGDGIYIWGAQLEVSSAATPYQKVVTAFEVTEAGVPTCHYCAYAGANSMATAAIDFTATDKMSVFAGIRKLSDAAVGIFLELSANVALNAGSFYMAAPETTGAGGDFSFKTRGSVNPSAFATSGTMLAPTTRVLTGLGDISADLAGLRVNGGAQANYSADQGTGNFGNHILYIGRRGGSTLPFNGRDYGIVIVGKAASAAEINITEAWLAANTPTVVL